MKRRAPTSLELFTGAGGLALGVAHAGFEHAGLVEWNSSACDTLRANIDRVSLMRNWMVHQGDVRAFNFAVHAQSIDLLAAGAPCQPFSLAGKHRGDEDTRNMFPEVFRAASILQPRAIIVENVKGLLRPSFREYFEYIVAQLAFPALTPKHATDWRAHRARLDKLKARPPAGALHYRVKFQLVNAADMGVPQHRERVFIVAYRDDLDTEWPGLFPTHSEDSLLYDQYVSGDYWSEHGLKKRQIPPRLAARVDRLWSAGHPLLTQRWRTVRDALRGLPEPRAGGAKSRFLNHVLNPGARSYPGHTGSPYDRPAKTLKAGDHGVPGGENTLRLDDGTVRYFSVREAARLQTFPDEYSFSGPWSEGFRQLGNAVPVQLSRAVAESVAEQLRSPKQVMRIA